MQAGRFITLSVWLMILFNLLLSFGAVWSFQRMNPEIRNIYERNVVSLDACEQMLMALTAEPVDKVQFKQALDLAGNNITENGENETLRRIQEVFAQHPDLPPDQKGIITREIVKLTNFNKKAIFKSALQTQKLRQAGAWGIVFMTIFFFAMAIYFEQRLRRTLLMPLREIYSVMEASAQGDKFRRCNLADASQDMKKLFTSVNELLDRNR